MIGEPGFQVILNIAFSSGARLPGLKHRDCSMQPYIHGSTLKGAVRASLENLLDIGGIKHCSEDCLLDSCESSPCLICSLFGSQLMPGKLVFEDAVLSEESLAAIGDCGELWENRTNRRFDASGEKEGFVLLATKPFANLSFEARIVAASPISDQERELLLSAIGTIRSLGGGKGMGLGFCTIELKKPEEVEPAPPVVVEVSATQGDAAGIVLVAQSPICIARSTTGRHHRDGLEYIPGASLRAAIYEEVQRAVARGELTSEHSNACLSPSLFFHDCLPITPSFCEEVLGEGSPLVLPFIQPYSSEPSATRAISGVAQADDVDFPASDALIRDYVLRLLYLAGMPCIVRRGRAIRTQRASFLRSPAIVSRDRRVVTERGFASFCPVNRKTGRTDDSRRHTASFIRSGSAFAGKIGRLRPASKEVLKKVEGTTLCVGSMRSRGFGQVLFRSVVPPLRGTIAERLKRFNRAVSAELENWSRLWEGAQGITEQLLQENAVFFSITLQSDMMLPDWSRWNASESESLEKLVSESGINAKAVAAYLRSDVLSGWNVACNAPRALAPVLCRGSVCLFKAASESFAEASLIDGLQRIQDEGLGLRICDGFGSVSVCDGFHISGVEHG
ncbi:hypothetical protein J7M28_09210 [bacterium]|nr:hypothetical protein [bacterium]